MLSYLNTQSSIPISEGDIKNTSSNVSQLIDILGIDISSKNEQGQAQNTRRSYEVWMSGSTGDSSSIVKSSLYQTVYDQEFSLQTSNELLDITAGLCETSDEVVNTRTQTDSSGKMIFPDATLMIREKIYIYKQYAQYLLGDAEKAFYTEYDSIDANKKINSAIFLNIKRLFCRDAIKKETFALRMFKSTNETSTSLEDKGISEQIYSDSGSLTNHRVTNYAGSVASLKDSSNNAVGLCFYDRGIIVLDASKIFDYENFSSTDKSISDNNLALGSVWKIADLGDTTSANWELLGTSSSPSVGEVFVANDLNTAGFGTGVVNAGENLLEGNIDSVLTNTGRTPFKHNLKNLFVSGSIDDIVDHVSNTRFTRDNTTSLVFQNKTIINSTLIFCRAAPSQANYSSNPSYTKEDGSIRVVEEENDDPYAYVTTIGLYNATNDLVAVAKTSRPIEKNPETDLSIRIRLDF
jgi:hypothetical protein